MMESLPEPVAAILNKLDDGDKEVLLQYIQELKKNAAVAAGDAPMPDVDSGKASSGEPAKDDDKKEDGDGDADNNEPDFPPVYSGSGEDYDKAAEAKQQAADLKGSGDWEKALEQYTIAVLAAPPSALLYANRALALLQLNRPKAAERDCNLALAENPDSAKALRVRGKARKALGHYELALKDLSASQAIDFDEGTVEDLKFLSQKHQEADKAQAAARNQEEERLRQRAEEIKRQRAAEKEEEAAAARQRAASMPPNMGGAGMPGMGGMPNMGASMPNMGGGMPGMAGGGMPGMPNMADLMSDPELMAAMSNPKVLAAMQELMMAPGGPTANPAKISQLMSDPEVGPVLQKLMTKFGGGAAGMPGVGVGGAGMGPTTTDHDDEDIPDLEDLPELD